MSRFVSKIPSLALQNVDGKVVKQFVNGVYNGTITEAECYNTAGAKFILQPKTSKLDLSGKTVGDSGVVYAEICGLGSLNGKSNSTITNDEPAGAALDADAMKAWWEGLQGLFFYSPALTVDASTGYTVDSVGFYEVDSKAAASVTFRSQTYKPGEIFFVPSISGTAAENVVAVASGTTDVTIYMSVPPDSKCACNLKEWFKINHLQTGDEPLDYYLFNQAGYTPNTPGYINS